MKKILLKTSVICALILICGACIFSSEKVSAQLAALINPPFAGKISQVSLCCNGVRLQIDADTSGVSSTGAGSVSGASGAVSGNENYQSPIDGDMIFPWQNMIPIPFPLGWGLYQGWKLMPGTSVLGRTSRGGQCQLIYTYCEYSENVDYTILEMGTKQKESSTGGASI